MCLVKVIMGTGSVLGRVYWYVSGGCDKFCWLWVGRA